MGEVGIQAEGDGRSRRGKAEKATSSDFSGPVGRASVTGQKGQAEWLVLLSTLWTKAALTALRLQKSPH